MRTQPRSLMSYLLLPRPGDVVKMLIFPVGFFVGVAGRAVPEPAAWWRAAIVWACLELLVYQARYQWNDIRGFEADQQHPGGDRGRLPGPLERRRSRIGWSAMVATAKVALAVGVGLLLGRDTALLVGGLCLGVFGLAALYEWLRATATGRSGAALPPVTPGIVAIWLLIGSGYALRAVAGLGMAVDLRRPNGLLLVAALTCWLFGIGWITSRWAVEATSYASIGTDRALGWRTEAGQAREHLLALVRWLPARAPTEVTDPRHWQAVRSRPSSAAPWSIAGALSLAAATVAGIQIADPSSGKTAFMIGAAAGLVTGGLVQIAGLHRGGAVAFGAVLMAAVAWLVGAADPIGVVVPWAVIAVAQERYLRQDQASLGTFLRRSSSAGGRTSAPPANARPETSGSARL